MTLYREITGCRACSSPNLESALDLGNLCVSDFLDPANMEASETRAPLELVCCQECTLVQLRHTVDRSLISDNYYYRSSTNESMVAALRDVAVDAVSRVDLKADDFILDIGANDGTLLAMYPRHVWCHGYEPAKNLAKDAVKNAHARIWMVPWPPSWAIPDKYKIITSIACFYSIDKPNQFVARIKECLHPEGVWICQMQDFHQMLACHGFDNICHEHLEYWTSRALSILLHRHGLQIDDISRNKTNGGSVRYTIKHGPVRATTVDRSKAIEIGFQLQTLGRYIERLKAETVGMLEQMAEDDKMVLGVAASTKANTLLQVYGITPDLLPAIVDRNPDKVGKVMVGAHIPIVGEDALDQKPDALFALAWHFMDSFRDRYKNFGGEWIVPLPSLQIQRGDTLCRFIPDACSENPWVSITCATPS